MKKTLVLFFQTVIMVSGAAQCVSDTITVNCGNTLISFNRQQYDTSVAFALVHVHENETTALQAAQWLLDSLRRGSLTTWRVQQQRLVNFSFGSKNHEFDPNRIYSLNGITATLGNKIWDTASTVVQMVADTFLNRFILGKNVIVALHNNTNEGGLTVKSYTRGERYFKDAQATFINPRQDADDFFYTTEPAFFNYLKSKRYNVVMQNNEQVQDDGSLSVFCSRHGILYVNVEAENKHLYQQKKMLQVLFDFILKLD